MSTPWLEVATIAFFAQLTVLPGEKVQFIIAGLSTRYHPLLVVSAAGSAFAGWTAIEILVGNALQETLPTRALDVLTGLLFLGFAVALVRSAPTGTETRSIEAAVPDDLDIEVPYLGWDVPRVTGGFLPVFVLMAVGEVGDKTQLVTIGLAAQYAHGTAIWAGEMVAIIPVSLANALLFFRLGHRLDIRRVHLASAALFGFFGLDTLQSTVTGIAVWELLVTSATGLV